MQFNGEPGGRAQLVYLAFSLVLYLKFGERHDVSSASSYYSVLCYEFLGTLVSLLIDRRRLRACQPFRLYAPNVQEMCYMGAHTLSHGRLPGDAR